MNEEVFNKHDRRHVGKLATRLGFTEIKFTDEPTKSDPANPLIDVSNMRTLTWWAKFGDDQYAEAVVVRGVAGYEDSWLLVAMNMHETIMALVANDRIPPPSPIKIEIDFAKLTDGALLTACGDDASKWAAAFCQVAKELGVFREFREPTTEGAYEYRVTPDGRSIQDIDEGWMIGWFANAIEHATEVRRRKNPRLNGSEAVFGMMAWLTSRRTESTFSAHHEASTAVELARKFCDTNDLDPIRDELWPKFLTHPKE